VAANLPKLEGYRDACCDKVELMKDLVALVHGSLEVDLLGFGRGSCIGITAGRWTIRNLNLRPQPRHSVIVPMDSRLKLFRSLQYGHLQDRFLGQGDMHVCS
jgi:hypothetical protein